MKTALLAILVLSLLHGVLAGVLTITMDVYQNDTAFPLYMHLSQRGTPSLFQGKSGLYRLEVIDGSGRLVDFVAYNLSFYVMSDPPTKTDHVPITATLYVNEQASKLNLYKGSHMLFSYDLPKNQTCQRDGICEAGESCLSCPEDCSIKTDGVCMPMQDSVCDPDCPFGVDLDCAGWKRPGHPINPPSSNTPPIICICGSLFIGLFALGLIAWLFFCRSRKAPPETGHHLPGHSTRNTPSKHRK